MWGDFMSIRCEFYIAIEEDLRENCANCKRWTGKRCKDENLIREEYLNSDEFDYYDRMMRDNKGVKGPL